MTTRPVRESDGARAVGVGMSKPTDIDPRLAFVDCMVEATSFEHQMLWENHASQDAKRPVQWEESSLGHSAKIGEIGGLPIWVSWRFAIVGGAVLCFYEATSRAVDHDVVSEWALGICPKTVDAQNFHNRPRPELETANAVGFRKAEEDGRARSRAEFDAQLADIQAKRDRIANLKDRAANAPTQSERDEAADELHEFIDRDDATLADRGLPDISDGQLAERVAQCIPIDAETMRAIELPDLRRTAFTWGPTLGGDVAGLVPAKVVKTLHSYGHPSLFKPSIAEVLAQAPEDLHFYVAFSTRGPDSAEDMNRFPECTQAGYHVAETTFYVRGES